MDSKRIGSWLHVGKLTRSVEKTILTGSVPDTTGFNLSIRLLVVFIARYLVSHNNGLTTGEPRAGASGLQSGRASSRGAGSGTLQDREQPRASTPVGGSSGTSRAAPGQNPAADPATEADNSALVVYQGPPASSRWGNFNS